MQRQSVIMLQKAVQEDCVILHNATTGRWQCFETPCQIFTTTSLDEVASVLRQIETLVNIRRWFAAGFIGYEAASAFDPALRTRPGDGLPLLWFGLYPAPEEIKLPPPHAQAYSLGDVIPSVSQSEYDRAIRSIKNHIHSGDTYQVNYTLRLRAPFFGDPWHLFLAMVRAQSPGYSAFLDAGRFAICSASPELFFRLDGDHLTCKPMKGTVKRGRTLDEDIAMAEWLHYSEKNRAENLMIVDMIRNDLGRVADIGSVHVPRLFEVERHPTLWQMTSTVEARCGKSIAEILTALFPCASITGAPKIRTTHIIADLETAPRGIYTGCIGFISPDRFAQFNVAIRTAVVDRPGGQVEYGAGGGIVSDSVCEEEYTEALLKARVLTEQCFEFCLLETMLWTPEDSYFLLDRHLNRLANSAVYFNYPLNLQKVKSRLNDAASGFSERHQRVRVLLARNGSLEVESVPLVIDSPAKPVRVKLAHNPVYSDNVFLYHKTTQRETYEAARQSCPDCDDVLLWNERNELTESCISNVVVEMDGKLLTPPVDSGLLAGTFRGHLLETGEVREQRLLIGDLKKSSKIYLINSVRKWQEAQLI
jgi:para-aminobenzoate synthetase/4-amino-4-deoxychorismate lyase